MPAMPEPRISVVAVDANMRARSAPPAAIPVAAVAVVDADHDALGMGRSWGPCNSEQGTGDQSDCKFVHLVPPFLVGLPTENDPIGGSVPQGTVAKCAERFACAPMSDS